MGPYLRMKPIYRDSSSDTVLSVHKEKGYFIDFSKQIKGSFEELIRLSLGLDSIKDAKEFLSKKPDLLIEKNEEEFEPSRLKIFNQDSLKKMIKDHSYWVNRGISEGTLEEFKGGIVKVGKMENRYVFPIFKFKKNYTDTIKQLIGVSGRYLSPLDKDSKIPKWKHIGSKSFWVYPSFLNEKILEQSKEVVLVESIGDMLALWECGIKNCLVTFGLTIQTGLLSYLLENNFQRITIAFNNDENKSGYEGARKAQAQLLHFFDEGKIKICLPSKNDFGEMTTEEIYNWEKQTKKSYQLLE